MTQEDHSSVKETAKSLQVGLASALEESIVKAKKNANVVEEQYFTPLSAKAQDFGERNPIIFTFLVVFTLLSSVPILFAFGFIAISFTTLTIGVVTFCIFAIGTTLFLTCLVLTPILILTASVATFSTGALIALFLASRLYILTRDNNFSLTIGLSEWLSETKARFARLFTTGQGGDDVSKILIHGKQQDDGDVDVNKVELQLTNGRTKRAPNDVKFVLDEKSDKVKAQERHSTSSPDSKPHHRHNSHANGHSTSGEKDMKHKHEVPHAEFKSSQSDKSDKNQSVKGSKDSGRKIDEKSDSKSESDGGEKSNAKKEQKP